MAAAKQSFQLLHAPCFVVDSVACYASLVRRCGDARSLEDGKRLHAHVIHTGHSRDRLLANLLVEMYGKCGALEDARAVFVSIQRRNVFSWSIMIAAYVRHGRAREALLLFREMEEGGVILDKVACIGILSACASPAALDEGKRIHARIMDGGWDLDVVVGNALVNMYVKCGRLQDARRMFERISERNVVSWNCMVAAYAQQGQGKEAILLFQQMVQEGVMPDKFTFLSILSAITSCSALADGKRIHSHIVANGFEKDFIVATALVNMYGKCGSLQDAHRTFDTMPERDAVAWNALMAVYAHHGYSKAAFQLFQKMDQEGVIPDKLTFVSILSACADSTALVEGKWLHAQIVASGFESDVMVGTALVNMYGKCGRLEDARRTFDKMPERNAVSWSVIITACARHGHGKEALHLFQQMQLEGVNPDRVTFISILSACASQAILSEGKRMHAGVIARGFDSDIVVGTALINMYGKCGSLDDARRIFDTMPNRNVVSWNSVIAAYAQNGQGKEAIRLFQKMQLEGVLLDELSFVNVLSACVIPESLAQGKAIHAHAVGSGFDSDVVVGNAVINMYAKCGSLEDSRRMFDQMSGRDVIAWNVMIAAYTQHGHWKQALQLFQQMQLEGVIPDKVTIVSILSAYASQAALTEGKQMHAYIVDSGFELDVVVGNALINMYGKCGSLENAWCIFQTMPQRNVISWNAMVAACAQNGQAVEALQLFQQMQLEGVVIPDEVTFVSVLFACSHSGLVDQGYRCFVSMGRDHGIAPTMEHYNCMIDILGRAGLLDEGECLIMKMPYEATALAWMTLLGACRMYSDVERGKRAAEHIFGLDPDNTSTYVLLSNIYAAAGKWDDAAEVRKIMEERDLKKQPGYSSVEVGNRVHDFFVGD